MERSQIEGDDLRWMRIPIMYDFACAAPRNPKSWAMHSERAIRIHELLRELAPQLDPLELTKYRGKIVEATRTASRLNPTNSELHVRLAQASADIMMFQDAVSEANEALRLDRMTPHAGQEAARGFASPSGGADSEVESQCRQDAGERQTPLKPAA